MSMKTINPVTREKCEVETIEDLLKLFQKNKRKIKESTKHKKALSTQYRIREQMQAILQDVGMISEKENREKSLDFLAKKYITIEFGAKYDELYPELFTLYKDFHVITKQKGELIDEKIPLKLFAYANLHEQGPILLTEFEKSDRYKDIKIKLETEIPPIPRKSKTKARQAKSDFYEIFANALKQPVIGDWLLRGDGEYEGADNFDLGVYWIPKPEEIADHVEIDTKDPLIVAKTNNQYFLIDAWNVEGELPFEHYLMEYKV